MAAKTRGLPKPDAVVVKRRRREDRVPGVDVDMRRALAERLDRLWVFVRAARQTSIGTAQGRAELANIGSALCLPNSGQGWRRWLIAGEKLSVDEAPGAAITRASMAQWCLPLRRQHAGSFVSAVALVTGGTSEAANDATSNMAFRRCTVPGYTKGGRVRSQRQPRALDQDGTQNAPSLPSRLG